MTLVLNDDDVSALLTMEDCIQALEAAFRDLGEGKAVMVPRHTVHMAGPTADTLYQFKTMEGGLERAKVFVQRSDSDLVAYPVHEGVRRFEKLPGAPGGRYVGLVFLFSTESLELLAIITDGHLQRMRVAGVTGVAAKYLSRPDARRLALLGSGWQAETALRAIATVRPLEQVRVYSPSREHRTAFARSMGRAHRIEVLPVDSPDEAVRDADIVAAATNALVPVILSDWLGPGVHVTTIGPAEADEELWRRADLVVISGPLAGSQHYYTKSAEHLAATVSDRVIGLRMEGQLRSKRDRETHLLQDVLLGRAPVRTDRAEITFFYKNAGLAIEFASVGRLVYDRAVAARVGKAVPSEWFSQTSHP